MKPIAQSSSGSAVEDIQQRLVSLSFSIHPDELADSFYGPSTAAAVALFRSQHGLPLDDCVDDACWNRLVEETYQMGDRTLYLRMPYFKGADVKRLQIALNVLGFSCGVIDGLYGPMTEAAVREFQSNVGLLEDGMAFQDTFDAIERLRHAWGDKPTSTLFADPNFGLLRAPEILEANRVVLTATDQIGINVVTRMWNVACATTEGAQVAIVNNVSALAETSKGADLVLIVSVAPVPRQMIELPQGTINIVSDSMRALAPRLSTAIVGHARPCCIHVELSFLNSYDGSVTARDIQSTAIQLLDMMCASLGTSERR